MPQLNSSTGQALRLQHNGGVEFGSPNLEGHPYCHPSSSPIPSSTSAREKEFTCFAARTMRLVSIDKRNSSRDFFLFGKNPQPDIRLFAET